MKNINYVFIFKNITLIWSRHIVRLAWFGKMDPGGANVSK